VVRCEASDRGLIRISFEEHGVGAGVGGRDPYVPCRSVELRTSRSILYDRGHGLLQTAIPARVPSHLLPRMRSSQTKTPISKMLR
jgi:hypothetical protein